MPEVKREYLSSFAWYENDGSLHIDAPALLRQMNVADTPENREQCVRIFAETFRALLPTVKASVVKGQ